MQLAKDKLGAKKQAVTERARAMGGTVGQRAIAVGDALRKLNAGRASGGEHTGHASAADGRASHGAPMTIEVATIRPFLIESSGGEHGTAPVQVCMDALAPDRVAVRLRVRPAATSAPRRSEDAGARQAREGAAQAQTPPLSPPRGEADAPGWLDDIQRALLPHVGPGGSAEARAACTQLLRVAHALAQPAGGGALDAETRVCVEGVVVRLDSVADPPPSCAVRMWLSDSRGVHSAVAARWPARERAHWFSPRRLAAAGLGPPPYSVHVDVLDASRDETVGRARLRIVTADLPGAALAGALARAPPAVLPPAASGPPDTGLGPSGPAEDGSLSESQDESDGGGGGAPLGLARARSTAWLDFSGAAVTLACASGVADGSAPPRVCLAIVPPPPRAPPPRAAPAAPAAARAGGGCKTLFIVRHGESTWNEAQSRADVLTLVSQTDHPLNGAGVAQARRLCSALDAELRAQRARAASSQRGEGWCGAAEGAAPGALAELLELDELWSSPLTRAVQTALVAFRPLLRTRALPLRLRSNAREKKNRGGNDTIGAAVGGEAVRARALGVLRPMCDAAELREMEAVPLRAEEVEAPWWDEAAEGAAQLRSRLHELLSQLEHAHARCVALVGHSHLFRVLFREALHPDFVQARPALARRLSAEVLPNLGVVRLRLDFGRAGAARQPVVGAELVSYELTPTPALTALPEPNGALGAEEQRAAAHGATPPNAARSGAGVDLSSPSPDLPVIPVMVGGGARADGAPADGGAAGAGAGADAECDELDLPSPRHAGLGPPPAPACALASFRQLSYAGALRDAGALVLLLGVQHVCAPGPPALAGGGGGGAAAEGGASGGGAAAPPPRSASRPPAHVAVVMWLELLEPGGGSRVVRRGPAVEWPLVKTCRRRGQGSGGASAVWNSARWLTLPAFGEDGLSGGAVAEIASRVQLRAEVCDSGRAPLGVALSALPSVSTAHTELALGAAPGLGGLPAGPSQLPSPAARASRADAEPAEPSALADGPAAVPTVGSRRNSSREAGVSPPLTPSGPGGAEAGGGAVGRMRRALQSRRTAEQQHAEPPAAPPAPALVLQRLPCAPQPVKRLFLVRHGQSRWNEAKQRRRALGSLVLKSDHPLSEEGVGQACALRAMVARALADSAAGTPAAPAHEPLAALARADALWSSPLTRALQTALLAFWPLASARGLPLQLRRNARDAQRLGELNSRGVCVGAPAMLRRAVDKLRELRAPTERPELAAELAELEGAPVESVEVEEPWWDDGPAETAAQVQQRLGELMRQVQYAPHETIVLVTHGQVICDLLDAHTAHALGGGGGGGGSGAAPPPGVSGDGKVPSCAVVCCTLDFGRASRVITECTVVRAPP